MNQTLAMHYAAQIKQKGAALGADLAVHLTNAVFEMNREVIKKNPPILLAFWPVFFFVAKGEYSNMHLLPRLEHEQDLA